jgi:molybdate transport system substrate-binding protein
MRVVTLLLAAALALAVPRCGGSSPASGGTRPALTVSAATSLKHALDAYARAFRPARVRAQYAGSDQLAAQIRQGVRPDVFAAANTALPEALHRAGLVGPPRVFAGNELVLAVPAHSGRVRRLADLGGHVTLAVGAPAVPVGAYTRQVLDRLGGRPERAILANVRSEEPDVGGVVGKVAQGAVDAGFVYRTDVRAAGGKLRGIALPARLEPRVAYAAAVVKGARQPALAARYVAGLVDGAGRRALRGAGFLPPPR